ncbi:hypothetical protein H0H92_000342 [Tricholoma furcatifolium]|nr:hypothetical protein H0H92_000342 [Tricholoma furcatifolium]
MDTDFSDILGGPTSPNARDSQSGWWSSMPLGGKLVLVSLSLLVLYVIGIRVHESYLVWREKAYKLAMRRKHGIPDNDHRAFNVAYAAVMRARQDAEEKARKARLQEILQDQQDAPPDQNIRQRNTRSSNPLPGRYASADVLQPTFAPTINYPRVSAVSQRPEEHRNPHPTVRIADPEINDIRPKSGPSRHNTRDSDGEGRKRVFDDSGDSDGPEYTKRSRVSGDIERRSDTRHEWIEERGSRRGSKRGYGEDYDDDDMDESGRAREKRPRKVSLDTSPPLLSEDMDIDEAADEVGALNSSYRGKKRDRAEAGSTFGGDDEDDSSGHEEDSEKRRRRHRKRRTYAKRKSDAGRGDSDGEHVDNTTLKASHKKGKKSSRVSQQDDQSDISMDESPSSRVRPRRSVGDEWESNGVKFKVGPNGQRLRLTLVKKERQKFSMPEDSQHPDRQANLEVYIETWLTEEEYREAKDQQLLAWQDSTKASVEPQTPTVESPPEEPPTGKNLFWRSTSGTGTSTPRQITPPPAGSQTQGKQQNTDLYGSSVPSNGGLHINPFSNPSTTARRISSVSRRASAFGTTSVPPSPTGPIPLGLSDGTSNSPRPKAFSKWEKQDLEAKAMMKMREANRLKEEERLAKLKKEQEAAAPPKPSIIPTITVTKADESKPTESRASTFSFPATTPTTADASKKDALPPLFTGPPSKPTSQGPPPLFAPSTTQPGTKPASASATDAAKPAGSLFGGKPEQGSSFVSFGPTSATTSAAAPTNTAPTNPGIPTSKPAFSFGPTSTPSQPTPATQSGEKKSEPAAPSFFANPAATSAPGAPQPAAQSGQTPSPFGFGKPSTGEAPKAAPLFGGTSQAASQPSAAAAQPAAASAATSTPKFNFNVGKPAPAPAPASSSSLIGALGGSAPKPSPFSFAAPSTSAAKGPASATGSTTTATSTGASDSTATGPKFSFAIPSPSPSNAFAATSSVTPAAPPANGAAAAATSTAPSAPSAPSAFSFGTAPASDKSATTSAAPLTFSFGKPAGVSSSAAPGASAFGAQPAASSTAAPTQSVFGAQPAASTSTTQSTFSFGAPAAGTSSAPASAFGGFGSQPGASASSTNGSVFGGASTFGTKPAGGASSTATPGTSVFGGSVFGTKPAGEASSTSTSATSVFGGGSTFGTKPAGEASSITTPATSVFGGGSAFGTKPAGEASSTTPATSVFGGGSAFGTKPVGDASTPAASAFGNLNGTATPSSFGGNNSVFGASKAPAGPSTTKDDASTKPVFSFGAPAVKSGATPTAAPAAPAAPALGTFGTTAPAFGTSANGTSGFTGFGKTATTDSPFGKPADPSAFGFGGGSAFSGFGKTPAATGQQQQQ